MSTFLRKAVQLRGQIVPLKRMLSYQALYEGASQGLTHPTQPIHVEYLELLSSNKTNTIENRMTGKFLAMSDVADIGLKTASRLKECGVEAGDHVMLCSPNDEYYLSVVIALMSLGAIPCLANPTYTEYELGALSVKSDAKFMIASKSNYETAKKVSDAQGIPLLCCVNDVPEFVKDSSLISKVYQPDMNDTAVIGYSSGTTGLPKGVQLTHSNLSYQKQIIAHEDVLPSYLQDSQSPQVFIMPFYHAYGFTQLGATIGMGLNAQLLTHFDPVMFLQTIQDSRAELLAVVPPILMFLAKHPVVDKFDLSAVRECISGAAPLSDDLVAELMKRHPNIENVRQGYGMTEVTAAATCVPFGTHKYGSVGAPVPLCKIKIVNPETDEPITDGGSGEILLGGPTTMKGYYKNDKANLETITSDGYIRTGDIGLADKDGDLWITDRIKELIKVKGYQVAPAELEGVLASHPGIADAAVIGIPDDRAGEVPKAFVTVALGANLTEEDVKNFISSRMSSEKHLGAVEFMEAIPKLPSGKILRKDLRKMEEERRK